MASAATPASISVFSRQIAQPYVMIIPADATVSHGRERGEREEKQKEEGGLW